MKRSARKARGRERGQGASKSSKRDLREAVMRSSSMRKQRDARGDRLEQKNLAGALLSFSKLTARPPRPLAPLSRGETEARMSALFED